MRNAHMSLQMDFFAGSDRRNCVLQLDWPSIFRGPNPRVMLCRVVQLFKRRKLYIGPNKQLNMRETLITTGTVTQQSDYEQGKSFDLARQQRRWQGWKFGYG